MLIITEFVNSNKQLKKHVLLSVFIVSRTKENLKIKLSIFKQAVDKFNLHIVNEQKSKQ